MDAHRSALSIGNLAPATESAVFTYYLFTPHIFKKVLSLSYCLRCYALRTPE